MYLNHLYNVERSKKSLLLVSCSLLNSHRLKSIHRAFRVVKLSLLLVLALGTFFPIQILHRILNLLSRNKSDT